MCNTRTPVMTHADSASWASTAPAGWRRPIPSPALMRALRERIALPIRSTWNAVPPVSTGRKWKPVSTTRRAGAASQCGLASPAVMKISLCAGQALTVGSGVGVRGTIYANTAAAHMQPGFRPLSLPCLIWQEWSHCDLGVGFSVVGGLEPADPRLIGPYQLLGRLGAGGMGRVFLGVSAAGRPVAVKVVHAELAADPEFRTRFRPRSPRPGR